jgi:two-component system chemotaxis sensor kinase CheA
MNTLDGVVKEFLVESHENLDQLDRDLVALEQHPDNKDCLASIFRTIHTIKGTCGFFGFGKLESVTHVGENLLGRLRDGVLKLDPDRTSALLALVDAVRGMLNIIERTGTDGDGDYDDLIDTLTRLGAPPVSGDEKAKLPELPVEIPSNSIGETLIRSGKVDAAVVLEAIRQQIAGDPLGIGEILVEKGAVKTQDVREAVAQMKQTRRPAVSETTIRVDVGLLEKLMNLVGELVLTRNQILQLAATQKEPVLQGATQRLNLITSELQESVMKTRMQPIGTIWDRFPRITRDLAIACGKEVRLEMEGRETELDKTILEAIKDPLTHLLRNSVDHGIEKQIVRLAAGKSGCGSLMLRAFHEGGQVNIELADDGAGINPDRIRDKAVERGLVSREQAFRMSDRDAIHMIFQPGFSTAETITNLSGRGVGMDVVKTNIEKIGGSVDIHSQPGKGTTIKIKIPLTLAIIPALIVTAAGDRFAIPQVNLVELVHVDAADLREGLECVCGTPVYRLRDRLLPLVDLRRELYGDAPNWNAGERDAMNVVVLQADERQFGLVVDGINDTEEIVVKPLGKQLKGIPVFAGATIMGDGRVALILDVLGIAQRARVVSRIRERNRTDTGSKPQSQASAKQSLLLLGVGADKRLAMPLSQVSRLEEIPSTAIEFADAREVVQYRDHILPLFRLSSLFGRAPNDPLNSSEAMQVVVYSEGPRSVGLVVDRILDIVETAAEIRETATPQGRGRSGVVGSAIIQNRVTDLVDVAAILAEAGMGLCHSAV